MDSARANKSLTFSTLVSSIRRLNEQFAGQAGHAVNVALTLRNWFIGLYITEFELGGADRAKYGEQLLEELARRLTRFNVSNCNKRQLYRYANFYRLYPEIVGTLSPQLQRLLPGKPTLPAKAGTPSPQFKVPPEKLISCLSYSQIELILNLDDPLQRAFYEFECLRGNWSVRELKRQIGSLYFERSGLSKDRKKLANLAHSAAEKAGPRLTVRDPYIFEFLGLQAKEVMGESDLEDALLDRLQEFLLELGHGFCFEARQKRILIGRAHGFVDLVFYHRILKCHILVELKVAAFSHEHLGQLNTYVTWYRKHMMTKGDNPPVGLLLCTDKDHTLVEYALAGLDNHLFVSKYQLELPHKKKIQRFLREQLLEAADKT